jgi:hypothetical protein
MQSPAIWQQITGILKQSVSEYKLSLRLNRKMYEQEAGWSNRAGLEVFKKKKTPLTVPGFVARTVQYVARH